MRKPSRRIKFLDWSRRQRRNAFVSMGWKIRTDSHSLGVFVSRYVVPGSPGWAGPVDGCLDASCSFLSRRHAKQGWIYGAEMFCPAFVLIRHISKWVDDRLGALLAAEGISLAEALGSPEMVPTGEKIGKDALYEIVGTPPCLRIFGDRTLYGMRAELFAGLSPAQWPAVELGAFPDPAIHSRVGLRMIVDEPYLDAQAIARQVNMFLDQGEHLGAMSVADPATFAHEVEAAIRGQVKGSMRSDLRIRGLPIPKELEV